MALVLEPNLDTAKVHGSKFERLYNKNSNFLEFLFYTSYINNSVHEFSQTIEFLEIQKASVTVSIKGDYGGV